MNMRKAILFLEACRDTHTEAVDYFERGFTAQDWVIAAEGLEEALGTPEFHEECARDYDEVIDFLKGLEKSWMKKA